MAPSTCDTAMHLQQSGMGNDYNTLRQQEVVVTSVSMYPNHLSISTKSDHYSKKNRQKNDIEAYTTDANGNVTRTDVTNPRGHLKRVEFITDGQLTKVTAAVGQPEEQVTEYERQPTTNLLLSVTDALEVSPGVRRK